MGKGLAGIWFSAFLVVAGSAVAAEVEGKLAWAERLELGMLVSGVIKRMGVQAGDRVERGATLVELDGRGFRSEVVRRKSEFDRAQILLDEATREDERSGELYERTLLSDHEREQTRIALKGAEAELEIARAALLDAELALERSTLRAPFAGHVLEVMAGRGQVVVNELQSRPLVVLAADQLLATATIDLQSAQGLRTGQSITVTVGGQSYPARIVFIGVEPVRETGGEQPLYAVRAALQGDGLRAGQSARLRLD